MSGAIRVCVLGVALSGCAARPAPAPQTAVAGAPKTQAGAAEDVLGVAEHALAEGRAARAVALFGRVLGGEPTQDVARQAHLGLASAHESLRDCRAAIRTFDAFLERFSDDPDESGVLARRGACEAELELWERSADSFARAAQAPQLLPSARIEALARHGFALFHLDRFPEADAALAEADRVFKQAQAEGSERFSTYYFVGMARFYRAAILHRKFRAVPIKLPEKVMRKGYLERLRLLSEAQEAYNHTIRAKHMFWVSASGYQLGRLFEEFYDSMMYAPIPKWLDARQRKVYFEELKKQLRPAVNKAIWVFEKNLETARKLGYESPFVEQTEAKLSELQAVLLAGDETWGRPHPRLVPEALDEVAPPQAAVRGREELSVADRKLFVPRPTPL